MYYFLLTIYIIACVVLILFVLLQPGKSDAAAVFGGGGANSSAFGPRGTQSVLAKITIGAAIVFFLAAFLLAIPGLFGARSVGEGVGPAISTPAEPVPAPPVTPAEPAPAPPQPNNAVTPGENPPPPQPQGQPQPQQ